MEKRLKLLQSGGQVIKAGASNGQKAHTPSGAGGYNNANDFVKDGGEPYKRRKED